MFKVFTMHEERNEPMTFTEPNNGMVQLQQPQLRTQGQGQAMGGTTPRQARRMGIDLNSISDVMEHRIGGRISNTVVQIRTNYGNNWLIEANFEELTGILEKTKKSIYK